MAAPKLRTTASARQASKDRAAEAATKAARKQSTKGGSKNPLKPIGKRAASAGKVRAGGKANRSLGGGGGQRRDSKGRWA